MRFATYESGAGRHVVAIAPDGKRHWAIDEVVPGFRGDMVDFVVANPRSATLRPPLGAARAPQPGRLVAPITSPRRNIFLVGKNYYEHAREFSNSGFDASTATVEVVPPAPSFFTKPASTIVGPDEPILSHPQATQQVDYEGELALVIGIAGRGIRREEAYAHVWGYTVLNDVTARDLQKAARQWFLGKALDTFCPMGPWIVTADEVDPENLRLRTWVNDEQRQDANTRDLIFDIPTLISTLSAGITLQPGDVISTGTPAGVGIGFNPPRFLKPGDSVRVEISGIGAITNTVV